MGVKVQAKKCKIESIMLPLKKLNYLYCAEKKEKVHSYMFGKEKNIHPDRKCYDKNQNKCLKSFIFSDVHLGRTG